MSTKLPFGLRLPKWYIDWRRSRSWMCTTRRLYMYSSWSSLYARWNSSSTGTKMVRFLVFSIERFSFFFFCLVNVKTVLGFVMINRLQLEHVQLPVLHMSKHSMVHYWVLNQRAIFSSKYENSNCFCFFFRLFWKENPNCTLKQLFSSIRAAVTRTKKTN